jgi:hypothetical protein
MDDMLGKNAEDNMAVRSFSDKRQGGFQVMTSEDLKALAEDHYPYIHAVGLLTEEAATHLDESTVDENNLALMINLGKCESPALIYGDMGWLFQYWHPEADLPAALVTSSGPRGFGRVDLEEVDDKNRSLFVDFEEDHFKEYLDINEEIGNHRQQILENAVEFVLIAERLGWAVIHITAGLEKMKRNVAFAAQILGMKVTGFELKKEDEAIVDKLKPFVESIKKHIESKESDAISRCLAVYDF